MTTLQLSRNEELLLRVAQDTPCSIQDLHQAAGLATEQAQSSAEALVAHHLLERHVQRAELLVITENGRAQAEEGLPELRLRERLEGGPQSIAAAQDLAGLSRAVTGSAFGRLKREGALRVQAGQVELGEGPWRVYQLLGELLSALARAEGAFEWSQPEEVLKTLAASREWTDVGAFELREVQKQVGQRAGSKSKRGKKADAIFELVQDESRTYALSPAGRERREALLGQALDDRPEVVQLTSDLLRDGRWREHRFRPFNIGEPPPLPAGRRDPYREYLDQVKEKLLALGFEEMRGSLVESELWNMDALFLPQFHPARQIHDAYYIQDAEAEPGGDGFTSSSEAAEGIREAVAAEHEGGGESGSRGWRYAFDRERSKRLLLRSQGTVLSARWLQRIKIPGKYFAMARCFRYDTIDSTHLPDFFQVEGIVSSQDINFRHLLGLLRIFAQEMAQSEEVRVTPDYFPFTEPSVQIDVRHPDLGWMELGGAGVFRPEVTRPHGVRAPVIAWGLGLDRMAMVALKLKDIRHLFANNIPDGLAGLRRRVSW